LPRVEQIKGGKVDPSDENMLKVTTDDRKAALDLRLVRLMASMHFWASAKHAAARFS